MKTYIKAIVLPIILLLGLTTVISAQNRHKTSHKTTVEKKAVNIKRVSSSKVNYKKDRKKVVSVRKLPNKTLIKHKGQNYYYSNNKFYTQSRGRYIVIAPKVGFRIKVLPPNFIRISYNGFNYFNADGIFYIKIKDEYEVVDPEIGTVVSELPSDYEKVEINGLTYYEYANILYEKIQVNGTRAYEVVGIIDIE